VAQPPDIAIADTKRSYNRRLFTVIAPRYDRITQILSFRRDAPWKKKLVAGLAGRNAAAIVDFACGTGDLTHLLREAFPQSRILGIDLTRAMVEKARDRGLKRKAFFAISDMAVPPLRDASLDLAIGGYALRNAPDLATFLGEVHRVLKPGGTAAFLDFSRSPNRLISRMQFTLLWFWGGLWGLLFHRSPAVYQYIAHSLRLFPDRNGLERLLEKCGFAEIKTQPLMAGMATIITFQKKPGGHPTGPA